MIRFVLNVPFVSALIVFLSVGLSGSTGWALTETANKIYEKSSPAVFQIQVVDIFSSEKAVIGSGFRFSSDGLFGTNYHVIADAVEDTDRYRIEYHNENGKSGSLQLRMIDVARDLAILKEEGASGPFLEIGKSSGKKGEHVYPMGNPLDLGMTITEGTYNGLLGTKPYQQILLSAPLNGGMSGGPAFDATGKVVGVNVAEQGNDLSYLVPIEYLIRLKNKLEKFSNKPEWIKIIGSQILAKFQHFINVLMKSSWEFEDFGNLRVPQNIFPDNIKCWGKSEAEEPDEDEFYSYSYKWCESETDTLMTPEFSTATIGYSFMWFESDSLNALKFHKVVADQFSRSYFYPSGSEKEVTEFACENKFVRLAGHDWKGAYCVRSYQKFPGLHDAYLSFADVEGFRRKHIIRVGLAGVNETLVQQFLKKFLGSIEWRE